MNIVISYKQPIRIEDLEIYLGKFPNIDSYEMNEDFLIIRVDEREFLINKKNILQMEIHK